ncbi:hypothetical protein PInf_017380 [Phytophthora infestans]|nr:hypothetical protein PInf_017380 [Phytophthora infestans]
MATPASHVRASSCAHKGNAHDHTHDHDVDELNEMDLAFDPTLASCCERDEHEYKKAMKLKAVLTAHDPTSSAVRMRQQLFQPPATVTTHSSVVVPQVAQPQQPQISDSESDSDDFDDSDDEFGMEAMLAARRKQLEQQFQKAAQDAVDGYGVVLDVALPQLVQELQKEPEVPRVVFVVDSTAEASEFLQAMCREIAAVAQQFLGTKFYVAMAARDEDALRQLGLASVPALAAFRRGECVDSIALDPKASITELEVLWEARFLPWLAKCNVLTSERQASQNRQSKSRWKKPADEDETEREGFDCGVENCRLRFGYEHEHVGTSQQTKDEIAAWRQSSA